MKTRRRNKTQSKSAFTLIEMSMALTMALGVAFALVALLQQQVAFSQALADFKFLRSDAPQINMLLTNIINKADNYRIYGNLSSAKTQTGAVQSDGRALLLRYRNPDGSSDQAIVTFETRQGEKQLNYYFKRQNRVNWRDNPDWTISTQPTTVDFDNSSGILLVTLTGPKGDQITYSGNPD